MVAAVTPFAIAGGTPAGGVVDILLPPSNYNVLVLVSAGFICLLVMRAIKRVVDVFLVRGAVLSGRLVRLRGLGNFLAYFDHTTGSHGQALIHTRQAKPPVRMPSLYIPFSVGEAFVNGEEGSLRLEVSIWTATRCAVVALKNFNSTVFQRNVAKGFAQGRGQSVPMDQSGMPSWLRRFTSIPLSPETANMLVQSGCCSGVSTPTGVNPGSSQATLYFPRDNTPGSSPSSDTNDQSVALLVIPYEAAHVDLIEDEPEEEEHLSRNSDGTGTGVTAAGTASADNHHHRDNHLIDFTTYEGLVRTSRRLLNRMWSSSVLSTRGLASHRRIAAGTRNTPDGVDIELGLGGGGSNHPILSSSCGGDSCTSTPSRTRTVPVPVDSSGIQLRVLRDDQAEAAGGPQENPLYDRGGERSSRSSSNRHRKVPSLSSSGQTANAASRMAPFHFGVQVFTMNAAPAPSESSARVGSSSSSSGADAEVGDRGGAAGVGAAAGEPVAAPTIADVLRRHGNQLANTLATLMVPPQRPQPARNARGQLPHPLPQPLPHNIPHSFPADNQQQQQGVPSQTSGAITHVPVDSGGLSGAAKTIALPPIKERGEQRGALANPNRILNRSELLLCANNCPTIYRTVEVFGLSLGPDTSSSAAAAAAFEEASPEAEAAEDCLTLQPDAECVICLSDAKAVILLPCRHLCVCYGCLRHIDKCPICRASFDQYIVMGDITAVAGSAQDYEAMASDGAAARVVDTSTEAAAAAATAQMNGTDSPSVQRRHPAYRKWKARFPVHRTNSG